MPMILVKDLAKRLTDSEIIKKKLQVVNQSNLSKIPYNNWDPLTLSHGYPGPVMLFGTLDRLYPTEGWDLCAHSYIVEIIEIIETSGASDISLFSGIAGCCFAIRHASRDNTRYQKVLSNLNEFIFRRIEQVYFKVIHEKLTLRLPIHPSQYDVMSGICGIGIYFLNNLQCSKSQSYLKDILKICVALTDERYICGFCLQGWYVPRHYQFIEIDKQNYPKGNFNLGIAHGISGVLGLLSIALLQGVKVEGQEIAIKKIIDWILCKKRIHKEISYWPNRISFEEEVFDQRNELSNYSVEAWCYGTPGVARILFLAGKALGNKTIQTQAQEFFFGIFERENFEQIYFTPTFCHGLAGILTLIKVMVRDTQNGNYEKKVKQIEDVLLKYYNFDYNFGFKNREIHSQNSLTTNNFPVGLDQTAKIIETENIGLLDGVAGILLSLISNHNDYLSWAVPFVIEGN